MNVTKFENKFQIGLSGFLVNICEMSQKDMYSCPFNHSKPLATIFVQPVYVSLDPVTQLTKICK